MTGPLVFGLLIFAQTPERFSCGVEGGKMVAPAMTSCQICDRVQRVLERSSHMAFEKVEGIPAAKAGWTRVGLRSSRPGIVTARVSRARGGAVRSLPAISVAVSDRDIGADSIDMTARDIALGLAN